MDLTIFDINILKLKLIPEIGNRTISQIIQDFPEIQNEEINWQKIRKNLSKKQTENLDQKQGTINDEAEKIINNFSKNKINILSINSTEYPEALKKIFNPPVQFYYKGNINYDFNKSIAVVGTRKYTSYGKGLCEKFVNELSEKNFCVISGLAFGIDSIAHITAIKFEAKCIAVIGSGFDFVYPNANIKLLEKIVEENGCIITEYLPHEVPIPGNFPMRNRIIAGLSKGTLVIEAAVKSGSLITAKYAFDESREVYAIPADLTRLQSQGCNFLIKNQIAKLVEETKDIFKDYGFEESTSHSTIDINKNEAKLQKLSEIQRRIYDLIQSERLNTDEISLNLNLEINQVNAELSELELLEFIQLNENGTWEVN